MSYLVTADVVRSEYGQPIPSGRELVATLQKSTPVLIIATGLDTHESFRHWLRVNSVKPDDVIYDREPKDGIRFTQLQGGRLHGLVTANTELAYWAMTQGITTLLSIEPKYSMPSSRPERKAWADIEAEIERQAGIDSEED